MEDIAFSDWPGQPVDLSGSNPWLPAYGYQPPSTLLDKDDFIGNPDAALFLHGGATPHYVFLETIVEETSDDLRSESDRSGSRSSPVGWLATDSESGSVIHVDLDGIEEMDSGSESEHACPAKRRRQDPNLLSIAGAGMYSDSDSNHSLSRSSSLLQFETLEKHCQEDIYSSSPSILSLFSQDSLEQQRKLHDLSPDSLDRYHSDSESESDFYKVFKIDSTTSPSVKSKRYRDRDSLFYNTKRLSDSDSNSSNKSDSDSQDSDETLQIASRSNSCKSVQNLKSYRSFDSLHFKGNCKKDKMSAENLSEDSGYSEHLCNYMKNKSSSIPNMQVQGITVPEKSTNKMPNELKKSNVRNSSNENMNAFRLKNIQVSDGFEAYDNAEGFQSFASYFGSSYQDLTVFEKYEPLAGYRSTLIDRFMSYGSYSGGGKRVSARAVAGIGVGVNIDVGVASDYSNSIGVGNDNFANVHSSSDWYRAPQTDVLNIGAPLECSATSKFSVLSSASEPNLLQHNSSCHGDLNKATFAGDKCNYFGASVSVVSSVPKDLNLLTDNVDKTWSFSSLTVDNRTSIAAKNWDLADLPTERCLEEFTDQFVDDIDVTDATLTKMTSNVYRQEGSNVTAMIRQRESSSVSSGGSDISVPKYRREGSYVKAISEYLDMTEITDDEQFVVSQSYQDPETSTNILDIETKIQKAISETSIQSFDDDNTKVRLLFHSTPINKRNVTSTPNLSSINCEKNLFEDNIDVRRSMQNVPRKSSFADRSASSSGVSEPDDKTITSKTLSGSGSTAKGVHFCPIVSEVSWQDNTSSSDDMSSYSISSTPHESSPEDTSPPAKPPRKTDMPRTPPRKSSSQPELPQNNDNETEYIFIPLNPQKWAMSSPNVNGKSTFDNFNNTKHHHHHHHQQQQQQRLQTVPGGVVEVASPPTGRHVVNQQLRQSQQQQQDEHQQQNQQSQQNLHSIESTHSSPGLHSYQSTQSRSRSRSGCGVISTASGVIVSSNLSGLIGPTTAASRQSAAAAVMEPVSPPSKPSRATKFGGFLSRFASFRFSSRKSHDDNKTKKKSGSFVEKKTQSQPQLTSQHHRQQQSVATEKDYIYIPLKGPLPPGLADRERDIKRGLQNERERQQQQAYSKMFVAKDIVSDDGVENNNVVKCISAKPPLPRVPPRVVSACVKRRPGVAPTANAAASIDSGAGIAAPRHACSMEPMGLIETDLDTEVTVITSGVASATTTSNAAVPNAKTRSLMNLGDAEPPPRALLAAADTTARPHKSMEFLLDKENLKQVEPPENELQKGTGERVMSEHQLRVQRSLQKLTVPDWYKANQVPREGFILKKQRQEAREPRWTGTTVSNNNSKTPSLSSLGSGHSPVLLSPSPHIPHTSHIQQPFTRWSTSKLNSAASSPCASTRSSFNHRTSNGGISPISVRSSFSYRQPYLGWRSQERLARPRTPAERLATSLLPPNPAPADIDANNPEIQSSIKEVTSAIVHYVSGLKPDKSDQSDRNSLSPTTSPRFRNKNCDQSDDASQRSASPQSRGSQKLCWLESSFVGTRPVDSPQTPVSLSGGETATQSPLTVPMSAAPPSTLRLDLQKNINNEMMAHMLDLNPSRPSPSSTTLEDVLDSLLGLPPSTRAPSPSLQETASANTSPSKLVGRGGDQFRRRSEGSEPTGRLPGVSNEGPRRVSFHASPSPSSDTNALTIKCRYSRCGKVSAKNSEIGKKYKNCHNCTYIYCSRECRRAHWEKHRMTCLFSRVGALCRQVLAAAKEHKETLKSLSLLARQGYLAQGNGAVKCFFSSPECAEKFIGGNLKAFGEPVYVPWADLLPSEMGPNLYSDLIKMCKTYNPDAKFVLYVSVCVVSEVPTSGAVKWERQLVSRCAKIRLCKSVSSTITSTVKSDKKSNLDDDSNSVILTTPKYTNDMSVQKSREISFAHILRQLRQRGVSLKRQFPDVYQKLCIYVEGKSDKFAPVTVYPKDIHTGKSFMCIIMPDITEPDRLKLSLPTDRSDLQSYSNLTTDVD